MTSQQYDDADRLLRLTHTAADETILSDYQYQLDGVGNRLWVTETLTQTTRLITNTYDALNRLTESVYSTSESFTYAYDAVGNRTLMTSTTPLSGTVVTTHTFDAANRLTYRARSDDRSYTYDWSDRNQMLAEWTAGVPVRTFDYDGAGRMTEATVFTLTTRFTYNGDGARRIVEVVGHGTTTYTVDYARGNRILAEETITGTIAYLYGHDCLGEFRDDEPALSGAEGWLYYLNDATGYVRQGADEQGQVTSNWLFDPDGTVLEGPQGPVSHLICGGVYDWSTGLIFKGGRYFDPSLGIWLALTPLVVLQSWRGRKRKRRGMPWYVVVVVVIVGVGGMLAGCEGGDTSTPTCTPTLPPGAPIPPPTPTTPPPNPTTHNIIITTSWGPKVTVLGQDGSVTNLRADWGVKYEIDRPGESSSTMRAGFLVQYVKQEMTETNVANESRSKMIEFWEAWRIPAGQNTPHDTKWWGDDNYFNQAEYTSGQRKVTGVIKFYEYEAEQLPGLIPGAVEESGSLPATYNQPSWWDDAGGTVHNAEFKWDTFGGTMQMKGQAGTQQVGAEYP